MTSNPTKRLNPAQTAARGTRSALLLLLVACLLSGCASVEKRVRSVPGFAFESWSHADHYALFTDSVAFSGAKWELNSDGSATLTIDHAEVSATWAGAIGPHDVLSKLVVNFPPETPQAQTLARGVPPPVPANLRR